MSSNWLPEKALAETKRWLADPFNESLNFQKPVATLEQFSLGREFHIGEVLTSLTSLSRWYVRKGIVELLTQGSTDYLCDSFWFDFFYNTIMRFSFQKERNQKKGPLSALLGKQVKPKPRIESCEFEPRRPLQIC